MYLQDELKLIAGRLFNENICRTPLDEHTLTCIYRYMGYSNTGSDLMRRLSDIEINYEQIVFESEQASDSISAAIDKCKKIFKLLIDNWNKDGVTDSYSFSLTESDFEAAHLDFSRATESIHNEISCLSNACNVLAETSAQLKACSASFLEVFEETRLASYAAALNKDGDNILSCQAIAFQAHDSSAESGRNATRYLTLAQNGTKAISLLHSVLSEATVYFSAMGITNQRNSSKIVNTFIRAIETLNKISPSTKNQNNY